MQNCIGKKFMVEKTKKVERITTEKICEEKIFFKVLENGNLEKTNNFDSKIVYREYGVKSLQAYLKEIEMFKEDRRTTIKETYIKNGVVVDLNSLVMGSGLNAYLALLTREVKNVEIKRNYQLATGSEIVKLELEYQIELY